MKGNAAESHPSERQGPGTMERWDWGGPGQTRRLGHDPALPATRQGICRAVRWAGYLGSGCRPFTKLQLPNYKKDNVYPDANLNRKAVRKFS